MVLETFNKKKKMPDGILVEAALLCDGTSVV